MDHIQLNSFLLALSQKSDCTEKAESISLLSTINRAFYIDDINYMSIADDVYTFWPLGQGYTDLFFYIRIFNGKTIDDLHIPSYYSIHISTKSEDGVGNVLDLLAPIRKDTRKITVNALPSVNIHHIISNLKTPFENAPNSDQLSTSCKRFVPTKETYYVPDLPQLSLRPHTKATFESICQQHPEIMPCYHPNSVLKRFIQTAGKNELNNITSEIDGFQENFWTLFEDEQPVLSVIPIVYPIGIMGFMHHHVLYKNNVSQDMINFALKSLCGIYNSRGYLVRTIPLFDGDPFESAKTLQDIGMVNDYQFVTVYKSRKKR